MRYFFIFFLKCLPFSNICLATFVNFVLECRKMVSFLANFVNFWVLIFEPSNNFASRCKLKWQTMRSRSQFFVYGPHMLKNPYTICKNDDRNFISTFFKFTRQSCRSYIIPCSPLIIFRITQNFSTVCELQSNSGEKS
jgi:hypothetical protein